MQIAVLGMHRSGTSVLTRLLGWFIRSRGGKLGLFGNLAVSNVPGPREPLYLGAMKVKNWFSTGQVFDGSSVNMTLWTYCGRANLCIFADQMVLPDGWKLFSSSFYQVEGVGSKLLGELSNLPPNWRRMMPLRLKHNASSS